MTPQLNVKINKGMKEILGVRKGMKVSIKRPSINCPDSQEFHIYGSHEEAMRHIHPTDIRDKVVFTIDTITQEYAGLKREQDSAMPRGSLRGPCVPYVLLEKVDG